MIPRTAVAALGLLALAAGCSTPAPAPAPAPATTSVAPAPQPAPTSPPAPVATSWVMPDLVGANLQDAQNAIQDLTDFGIAVTTSTDATGAGRSQLLDRNWTVCAQNVAPGATITADTAIDFAAVQLDESC